MSTHYDVSLVCNKKWPKTFSNKWSIHGASVDSIYNKHDLLGYSLLLNCESTACIEQFVVVPNSRNLSNLTTVECHEPLISLGSTWVHHTRKSFIIVKNLRLVSKVQQFLTVINNGQAVLHIHIPASRWCTCGRLAIPYTRSIVGSVVVCIDWRLRLVWARCLRRWLGSHVQKCMWHVTSRISIARVAGLLT